MRLIDVKNETNKDGSGKGQMTAWKVRLLSPTTRDIARCEFIPQYNCTLPWLTSSSVTGYEDV